MLFLTAFCVPASSACCGQVDGVADLLSIGLYGLTGLSSQGLGVVSRGGQREDCQYEGQGGGCCFHLYHSLVQSGSVRELYA